MQKYVFQKTDDICRVKTADLTRRSSANNSAVGPQGSLAKGLKVKDPGS
jgi:hypothetical protein